MAHSLTQRALVLVAEELTEGTALTVAVKSTSANSTTVFYANNTAAGGFNQAGDYWNNRHYFAELNGDGAWKAVSDWVNTTGAFTVASAFSTAPTASSTIVLRVPLLTMPIDSSEHGREFLERDVTRKTLSKEAGVVAGSQPTLGFSVELKGANTAGNFPEWDVPIRACGFVLDTATASGVQYRPVSTAASQESMCADIYLDGTKWTFTGLKGSFNCENVAVNQLAAMAFSMEGMAVTTTAAAIPATPPTYVGGGSAPPVINTTDFEYPDGTNLDVAEISLSVENTITRVQATNATSGTRAMIITERMITHGLNPEATDNTYLANLNNNTIQALDCTIGTVAGNKVNWRSPKVQLRSVSPSDDGGLRRFAIEGVATLSAAAGEDEIKIKAF